VNRIVLDASALLAYLHGEPGSEDVAPLLERASLSSLNFAEVLQRAVAAGVKVEGLREDLEAVGVVIEPFSAEDAEIVANLYKATQPLGLSLGDRACLGLALRLKAPALTADRTWAQLKIPGVEIRLIRS